METPRRRSQNREERSSENTRSTEENARDNNNPDIRGPENCVKAVKVLMQELQGAKKTLMNSENCVVNRLVMQAQLEYLDENLPDTVRKAAEIVQAEATIRAETEAKKNEILTAAQNQAEQLASETNAQARDLMERANQEARALMDRANQEANTLMDKANQEATACVEAARAEAARMIEDAEKKARQLVEEENIVRRARVESEELREKAQQDAATLHKNTLDYIDSMLADLDRNMSNMINSVRMERSEIKNHR